MSFYRREEEMDQETRRRLRDIELGRKRKSSFYSSTLGIEGMLAEEEVGDSLAGWLAKKFNHNFDAYDRAIDANSHIGGSRFHHLLDGQHTIWGAFKAVQNVSADDSWLKEMLNASEHLVRDLTSKSGINPFFSLTPEQFDKLGGWASHLNITKLHLADALTLNGPELLGGGVALLSAVMMGRQPNPERLSRLSGGCLLSAVVSGNPLLMPIAAAGIAYAAYKAENWKAAVVQAGKGALVSGSALLVSSLVGGPVWLGCVAGILASMAVQYALDNPQKTLEKVQAIIRPATRILRDVTTQLTHTEVPQWAANS